MSEATPTQSQGVPGRHFILILLILVYILNFLDRQIISILAVPIKEEFGISDSQLGWLLGLAFGSVYSVLAIPAAWLADLDPSELDRVLVPRPLPPVVANTYSARVAGEDGITVLDAIECWIYQHGLRHMGEIELARGLVGLGGMTS